MPALEHEEIATDKKEASLSFCSSIGVIGLYLHSAGPTCSVFNLLLNNYRVGVMAQTYIRQRLILKPCYL